MKSLFGNNPTSSAELKSLCASASAIARSFGHDYVGVEHMFLAIQKLPADHIAAKVLAATHVDLVAFWSELEARSRVITGRPVPAEIPFTPRASTVLRLADAFARLDSVDSVEILHLLFAAAHERKSLPALLLAQHHSKKFPGYDGYDMLSAQLVTLLRFDRRPYLAMSKEPKE